MFDRVFTFFKELPAAPRGGASREDDPRIAAAALLYHVMNADGVRQDAEWERIKELLSQTYDVEGDALDALAEAGAKADGEAIDLYAFTSVLNRHLDDAGRVALIRLMWEVVYADGELHELEEHTIWRVAELIGVDRRDRIAMRQAAARGMPGAKGESQDE